MNAVRVTNMGFDDIYIASCMHNELKTATSFVRYETYLKSL